MKPNIENCRSEMTKFVSEAINELKQKHELCHEKKRMIHDFVSLEKREWQKVLQMLQHILTAVICLLSAPIIVSYLIIFAKNHFILKSTLLVIFSQKECIVDTPSWLSAKTLTQPAANCHSICKGLETIPVIENASTELFLKKYAYSGLPVLVRGATNEWRAWNSFGFPFLKSIFHPHAETMEKIYSSNLNEKLTTKEAKLLTQFQFIPHESKIENLAEFFNISWARSKLDPSEESFYVGWTNCFPEAIHELRNHYSRPTFLPHDSESSQVDWIFIGGITANAKKGKPAHIDHVDKPSLYRVYRPSWYAVVSGTKTWTLYPPPECENLCSNKLVVDVGKRDLFIVDTNLWLSRTETKQGILTITIESEYD